MERSKIGTAMLRGQYLEYDGRKAKIVFVNERLLERSCLNDLGGYPIVGSCLSPQVQHGDLVIVAHNVPAQDGDIVMVKKGGRRLASRYRADGENIWLESAHGKQTLDGSFIIGVVLAVGRFPIVEIPIMGTVTA